jgi:predicted acylesterase/phospholipase RssA
VDGALVVNVPARAVREIGAPRVVAVSFGFALPFQPVESWRQVMSNAFDIAVNSQMRFEILAEADVLIVPDLDGMSKVRARDRGEIIEAGRRKTREALPALEELLKKEEGSAVSRWMSAVKERLVGEAE